MKPKPANSKTVSPPPQRSSRRQALRALLFGAAGLVCVPGRLLAQTQTATDMALHAQQLLGSGYPRGAAEVLRQALPLAKCQEEALWMRGLLARALYLQGRNAEALREVQAVLAQTPDEPTARFMLEQLRSQEIRQAASQDIVDDKFALRRVVLDPGHGGFDPGASHNGLEEKEVVLDIARRTARMTEQLAPGLRLQLTRSDDYYLPLDDRAVAANWFEADLFVSLHANAHDDPQAHGLETYRCAERPTSARAATVAARENRTPETDKASHGQLFVDLEEILFRFERRKAWQDGEKAAGRLQQGLAGALPLRDRGVHGANFAVLRKARMPAVLVETGFLSNPEEARLLAANEGRQRIAEALATQLARFAREGVA